MTTTKRRPKFYRAPLKSRKAQQAWLMAHDNHYDDCTHKYYLSWDVKLWGLDLSFANLLRIYTSKVLMGDVVPAKYSDPEWMEVASDAYDRETNETVYNMAVEDAQRTVVDSDGFQSLWSGETFKVEYAFIGRTSGHLVITGFDGRKVDMGSLDSGLDEWTAKEVSNLYRFIVQCDHDFGRDKAREEVEYQAAFNLFVNVIGE